jgi:phage gp29-like protein
VPLPVTKFIFHWVNGDGIAATRGYMRPATWLHMLKQRTAADWGIFLALFGIPNIWAKIPREKFEDAQYKATIEQALRDFGQGLPTILFDDQEVTIQPAQAGGGSNDVHSKMVGFCNAELSKIVQGETLTTELSQTGGYNTSDTHEATLYDTVKADGDSLDGSVRGQLFRAVLLVNRYRLAEALGAPPDDILLAIPKCEHVIGGDAAAARADSRLRHQQVWRQSWCECFLSRVRIQSAGTRRRSSRRRSDHAHCGR